MSQKNLNIVQTTVAIYNVNVATKSLQTSYRKQWRIQDFPEVGVSTLGWGVGVANIGLCQISPKISWNWKNLDPGASLAPPLLRHLKERFNDRNFHKSLTTSNSAASGGSKISQRGAGTNYFGSFFAENWVNMKAFRPTRVASLWPPPLDPLLVILK